VDELSNCDDLADTLAEVATGAASGADRAYLDRHLDRCDRCQRELAELSRVTDELLRIAPEREPPAGFESAVLARIGGSARATQPATVTGTRRRRLMRPLRYAALVAIAAAVAAAGVWRVTANDRMLASAYRETLDVADGRYFLAVDLVGPRASAGTVFLYEGTPSWLFVVARQAPQPGPYDVVVTTGQSRTVISTCHVDAMTCSAGATLDLGISTIDDVRLVAPDGTTYVADLNNQTQPATPRAP
jgi:hypothetical protein